jgi:D-sedoheptulose 7-phosphate isomerase
MNNGWHDYLESLVGVSKGLNVTTSSGAAVDCDDGFEKWRETTINLRNNSRTVYFIGNGASASMASHFAADLAKNGRVHTQTFFDSSLITAISNDISYEEVFAEPLRRRGAPGDMLVAISSSGESPNIIRAVDCGLSLGLFVTTLTAKNPSNRLRKAGNLNFYVPAPTYGLAETAHAAVLHRWMDLIQGMDGSLP